MDRGVKGRSRILYVVRWIPYIPSPGGITRSFHLVHAAMEVADVTLVGAAVDPSSVRLEAMNGLCERIHLVPAPARPSSAPERSGCPPWRLLCRVVDGLRPLVDANPYIQAQFDQDALQRTVRDLLQTNGPYDVVIVDCTETAAIVREVLVQWGGPTIANVPDVLSSHQQRVQRMQRQQVGHRESGLHGQLVVDWLRSIKRAVARIGTWRYVRQLQAIERDLLCSYTRVVAVSRVEAAHLRRLAPDKSVDVLASGVDVDYFGAVATWPREHSVPRPKGDTLVFLGSLAYHPNIHALQFFMDEVWPLVKRRRPHVRFWIVGASPGPAVQAMAEQDRVEVFASVPDVRPYLAASTVAIVPLFLGSGTRLKILEALAAHLPVVSTTFGAEGLDLEPGRDVLLADTAGAFAEAVCSLLECPDRAQELAHHGWETVRRAYSWDGIRARFRVMIQEVGAAHACGSL